VEDLNVKESLATYSQLRAALLEHYEHPPPHILKSNLEDHLEDRVFRPLQLLISRIDRLDQIATRIVTDGALADGDKRQLVGEFQETLEQILVDYQQTLLSVPTEKIERSS
jgi:hypothetical protein